MGCFWDGPFSAKTMAAMGNSSFKTAMESALREGRHGRGETQPAATFGELRTYLGFQYSKEDLQDIYDEINLDCWLKDLWYDPGIRPSEWIKANAVYQKQLNEQSGKDN